MNLKSVFVSILLFSFSQISYSSDQSVPGFQPPRPLIVGKKRPFRTGMMKMNADLDFQKPLAPADYSAWVNAGGYLVGSPEGISLVAFSLKKRTEVWRKKLSGDLSVPAFPVGDALILAQKDGTLSKWELQTGNKVWDLKLPQFVAVRLTRDNERVYAITASQVLYAIKIQDGKIEWLYDPELPVEIRIHNTAVPLVSVNQIYWGLSNGEILALETQSGKKLWRRNPKVAGGGRFHNYMGKMAVSNKFLAFCRYDGLIGAVSLEGSREGELVWQTEGSTGNCADSDYRNGIFYNVTTSGDVLALNAESGKNLWSGVKLGKDLSTITASEDSIYITGIDGQVYSLNNHDGSIVWYDFLDARLLTHPFQFEDKVYFPSALKNIYSYKN